MNFASKVYWIFLLIVVIGLWSLPVRLRKAWLLFTSFVFYASVSVSFLGLLVTAATLNHFGAKWIVRGAERGRRGAWIIAGNLLLLGVFKYLSWILQTLDSGAALLGLRMSLPIPKWALPLGISFYLFESISYIVDLIRKREKIHTFLDFQLFIAFFPKLLAGPILRAKEFLPQVERSLRLRPDDVRLALRQIVIGLFMKVILADNLAGPVDKAFARPAAGLTSIDVWLMGIGFGLQLYFDFSAYTRMAIGSARLCGIELVQNFDHPFISTSPPEFWRRWHMSLSRWIRDYLFYPLAQRAGVIEGSPQRVKLVQQWRLMSAAFLSMAIFGVWHGAGWPYLFYGLYHGVVLAGYHLLTYRGSEGPAKVAPARGARIFGALAPVTGWVLTTALMTIGFIIFRATSVGQTVTVLGRALRPWAYPGRTLPDFFVVRFAAAGAAVLAVGLWAKWRSTGGAAKAAKQAPVRESSYLAGAAEGIALGCVLVLVFLCLTGDTTFVYFQF